MLIAQSVWIVHEIPLFVHVIILSLVTNVHVYSTIEKIHVQSAVNVSMMLFESILKMTFLFVCFLLNCSQNEVPVALLCVRLSYPRDMLFRTNILFYVLFTL